MVMIAGVVNMSVLTATVEAAPPMMAMGLTCRIVDVVLYAGSSRGAAP